jgi:DNA-binding PadR family transcriptional regulator
VKFVILGMLLAEPLSMYEVHRRFERVVSLFYSASFGSIQRALATLVDDGSLTVEEVPDSARRKRLYRISPHGRREWEQWMRQPIDGSDTERVMLARVFFLGRLDDSAARAEVLDAIDMRILADLAGLRELDASTARSDDPVLASQLATLDYGIRSLTLAHEWIGELGEGTR